MVDGGGWGKKLDGTKGKIGVAKSTRSRGAHQEVKKSQDEARIEEHWATGPMSKTQCPVPQGKKGGVVHEKGSPPRTLESP